LHPGCDGASLANTPSYCPIRVGSDGGLGDLEDDCQPRFYGLDHSAGYLWGGVPVAGAYAAAAVQLSVATTLVAHQLIDHPGGNAGVF
jgi:hypothetical protein